MGILEDIATYIHSQDGSWVMGTNLFGGLMPQQPDVALALTEYDPGGGALMQTMSRSTPVIVTPRIQMQVRGAAGDYASVETAAMSVWTILCGVRELSLPPSNKRYASLLPISVPVLMNRDDLERATFVANFEVTKDL